MNRPPSSVSPASIALPNFRGAIQSAPPINGKAQSAPNAIFEPVWTGGASESFVRTAPVGSNTDGLKPVYTTSKRWRGIDVYLSLNGFFDWGVGASATSVIVVVLFATIQGVRTPVATGRYGFQDLANGMLSKHMISYRGSVAERFEVQFGINTVPADPTTAIQFVIDASDEAVSVGRSETEDVGTYYVKVPGANKLAFVALASFAAQQVPLTLQSIDAVSAVALTAATPRWVHVYDSNALGGYPTGQVPLFAYSLTDGGKLVDASMLSQHRFQSGAFVVISSTATTSTALGGAEDTGIVGVGIR